MKNTGFYWEWTRETPELKQQIYVSFWEKKKTYQRESHHILWLTKLNNLAIALFVMLNLSFSSSHLRSSFCLSLWVSTSLALLSFSPFFASHSYLLIALFSSRLVLHFPPLATLSVINMAARTGHVPSLAVTSVFDSAVKACRFLPVWRVWFCLIHFEWL